MDTETNTEEPTKGLSPDRRKALLKVVAIAGAAAAISNLPKDAKAQWLGKRTVR
jgi:hypothetical protein